MRKWLAKTVSLLLLATLLFCAVGCKPIGEENRKKLAAIPKEGNYVFYQGGATITSGNEYVNVESEAQKLIKKQGKKTYNLNTCDFYYTLSEEGDFMWFLVEYSHKSDEKDYQHGKFKYAIGSTPLPNVDVKIEHYLPTQTYYGFGLLGKLGDYFICKGEEDIIAYHLTTFESKTIDVVPKESVSFSGNNVLVLSQSLDGTKPYRIFDENLTEYTVSFEEESYWYARVKEEYIFYYAYENEQNGCRCINYKTGETFGQEQSFALYESFFASEKEIEEYPHNTFEYRGKTYGWENETYYVETAAKDESGNDIMQRESFEKLVFEDVETGEEYELIPTELTGESATVMQQILDIYGGDCAWKQVLVQNGELFFVMVNESSFFGIATPKTSPRIVFKYDEEKADLVYVGYAMYTYYDILKIYNCAEE